MNGWIETTLGEISKTIQYGYTESASERPIGPKFLRITDIQEDSINWDDVPYCKISSNDHKKYKLNIGDIVIARTGNSTGATAFIKDDIDAVFASYLIRYKIDSTMTDPFYVGLLLRSNKWKAFVNSVKGGSAQAGANAKVFAEFPVTLPPLEDQKKISYKLLLFDNKINLLRRQNETLEQIAQTLFKHWFVDFEFPYLPENYKFSGARKPDDFEKYMIYRAVGGLPIPENNYWFLYVLLCNDGSFYIGITNDLYRRFYEHKTGTGAKWTLAHEPKNVLHWEKFDSQKEAAEREKWFKTGFGRKWLKREYAKCTSVPSPNEGQAGSPAPKCQLRQAGEMVTSELGAIPLGWAITQLLNEIDVLRGLSYKGDGLVADGDGIPMHNLKSIFEGGGYQHPGIKYYNGEYKARHLCNGGDIIVSNTEQGEKHKLIGFPARIPSSYSGISIFTHHLFKINIKQDSIISPEYLYYLLMSKKVRHQMISYTNGTTVNMLPAEGLQKPIFPMPFKKLVLDFSYLIKPTWSQFENNINEINTLTKIRDSLLPKLMSGQIRVFE